MNTPTPTDDPHYSVVLPMPHVLGDLPDESRFSRRQVEVLQRFLALSFNAPNAEILSCIDEALATLKEAMPQEETAVQRAQKFDIFDSFFNVGRVTEQPGPAYVHGLLLTYANALKNIDASPHSMSVIELPLLRVAVESALQLFTLPK